MRAFKILCHVKNSTASSHYSVALQKDHCCESGHHLPLCHRPGGKPSGRPEFYPGSSRKAWADNLITEDAQYLCRYDRYGRMTEKMDRIPERVIRMHDERMHRYEYDNQHRLVHYVRTQYGETQAEGRYVYDPLGRRVGKREPVHWIHTMSRRGKCIFTTATIGVCRLR